jgi:hypothetical protein
VRKPTIYIDTNVFSAMFYAGNNRDAFARRMTTENWWTYERDKFELWTSAQTEDELCNGKYTGQQKAIKELRHFRYVRLTNHILQMATTLMREKTIPDTEREDAIQLSCAIIYEIDWLLTWNYSHLANDQVRKKLDEVCVRMNVRVPHIVSPDTIPWSSLGQEVRRKEGK